jgi:ubiquinone/menaquinone biosynthesis C-methylase UbiE
MEQWRREDREAMTWQRRSPRTLSHAQARAFYDRFASLQEWQAFYESPALDVLIREGQFAGARAVLELGCGTGRLAERLLADELPLDARYLGLDVSRKMVERTRRRLARFGPRAKVRETGGALRLPVPDASHDRFVATYVLDLLSESDVRIALEEAHHALAPGGLLCLASLSFGLSRSSRLLCCIWTAVHRAAPMLVGGCRPIDLQPFLSPDQWEISALETVFSFAVPTQVVVAVPRKPRR